MIINRLSELYNKLIGFPQDHTFIALEIPGCLGIYLAVDTSALPSLFITTEKWLIEPPLRTSYVSLLPNQSYRITLCGGEVIEKFFHVINFSSPNQADIETFLSLLETFIDQNNAYQAASANVMTFFRNVARLFSIQPSKDKISERQGLWGELFLMRSMRGYRFWAPYWHNEVKDVFDFSTSKKRVEVKTSVSGQRIHHITHNQVFPLKGEEIIFASLVVSEDQADLSLRELIDECKSELLGSSHFIKIEKAARHAAMHNTDDNGPMYSLMSATNSLAFFFSKDIPHFTMPEPPGVSQTSFRADLRNAPKIDIDRLDSWLDTWDVDSHSSEIMSFI